MRSLFVLNSADRASGTSSNFILTLYKPIRNVRCIKLRTVSFPNVVYNVNSSNNVINWTNGSTYNYQIPPGFYPINTLLSTIQTGMNNADPNSYALAYSNTTEVVYINGTAAFQINFGVANSCASLLGFPASTTGVSNLQTAPNAPNLLYPISIFINIMEIGTPSRVKDTNFTWFIPLINQNSTVLFLDHQQLGEQERDFPHPQDLFQFTVQVVDEYGNIINNLNLDWTISMEITSEFQPVIDGQIQVSI